MMTLREQLDGALDTFEALISKEGLISRLAIKKNIGHVALLAHGIKELQKQVDSGEESAQSTG